MSDQTAPKNSEDFLALKFAAQYEKQSRYTAAWGRWNEWNGHTWLADSTCRVFDRVRKVCRAESKTGGTPEQARKIASAATIYAVERLARADGRLAAVVEQWDANPWALNTPSGVIDLRTGNLRPARPDDYMTKITAVGPAAGCPQWMKFLERVTNGDAALQAYLQRLCGYCLTASTREHALAFLYGTGANGKSTFVNTITGIMGGYHRTAPIEVFLDSQNREHPTSLAWLQGARLVTATETEEGRRWAESKIKQLTGGDPIAARYMHCNFFEYQPVFKLVIQGNHKPALRSVDEAIRRRFNLLPFTVTIPEQERDKELGDKLRAEWPGILGWAVLGCLAWQREGLNPPAVVRDATDDYFAEEDALGRWLEEHCARDVNGTVPVSALWTDWKQWSEANNEWPGKLKGFSQNLAARGFQPGRTKDVRYFRGLRLVFCGPVPM